jgi:hypothetical protein
MHTVESLRLHLKLQAPKDHTFVYVTEAGQTLIAEVSPCCWMHANYGMQMSIGFPESKVNAEKEFLRWDTLYADCTAQECQDKLIAFAKEGGEDIIAKAIAEWKKARAAFEVGHAQHLKKQAAAEARADAKALKDGFTFKFRAVIHPKAGGDDSMIGGYHVGPREEVQAYLLKTLKRRGSAVLDDFVITPLVAGSAS